MSVIQILDKSVSELIAAGEVIEKPASVIKELVENAIDADAKRITVEIKNGGTTFMRITDDGCGMSAEDVTKAFLRHATSKVSKKADLDRIHTLGFRGEALASVAAVSNITVTTKRRADALGCQYTIYGGEGQPVEECGCPDGTTLLIKDLFFNVPARRKFMKSDKSEGNAISQIIQKIAISHPEIAFKFIRDTALEFHSDGTGELLAAIHAVYGKQFAGDLIPVQYSQDGVSVDGYVIKPLYAKSNRSFQNFFVNRRYIKSKVCSVAVESAYDNLLMHNKFPACVILLTMPPDALDVNIHPAKAEVRFSDEKTVIHVIHTAVKNAFVKEHLIYDFKMQKADFYDDRQQAIDEEVPEQKPLFQSFPEKATVPYPVFSPLPQQDMPFQVPVADPMPKSLTASANFLDIHADTDPEFSEVEQPAPAIPDIQPVIHAKPEPEQKILFPHIKIVGELFSNYIIAQSDDTMIIIDKHAAHERVIFEKLRHDNCQQYQQMLLTPCEVLLPMDEYSAMEENQEFLERLGFQIDFSNKPHVITKAAPVFFDGLNPDEIIQEIAHNLYLGKVNPQSHMLDDMLHELACKSAIRANDKNAVQELQALAEQVCNDDRIRHCPHGRPVMFTMSKYELEKQFKRR